jgi:hypothetical protein
VTESTSGKELEIAGSELTNLEAAKVFGSVLGKPVRFKKLPTPVVRLFLGREFQQMFRWFNKSGFQADIASLRKGNSEVQFAHTGRVVTGGRVAQACQAPSRSEGVRSYLRTRQQV